MAESACVMTITAPRGKEDINLAVEIDLAILLDKPLIVFALESRHASEWLCRMAIK